MERIQKNEYKKEQHLRVWAEKVPGKDIEKK